MLKFPLQLLPELHLLHQLLLQLLCRHKGVCLFERKTNFASILIIFISQKRKENMCVLRKATSGAFTCMKTAISLLSFPWLPQ